MDFKTKKLSGVSVEITVENSVEEVLESYQTAYKKARAKVKIPGFRPGKAPLEMVEKQLGESVANDAAHALIVDTYQKIVDQLEPPPINVPSFEVQSFDREKGAVFVGTYDTHPEVKLGKYKKLKATLDQATVSDETIEKEIEQLRNQNAILKTKEEEPAVNDDFVTLDIVITNDKGKSLYKNKELRFRLGTIDFPPSLNEEIEGKKMGESGEYESAVDAGFHDRRYAGQNIKTSYTITQLATPEYPELNDDFAKELGEYEGMDDLKQKIRQNLLEQSGMVLKNRAMEEILLQATEDASILLPESMIESEFDHRLDQIKQRIGNKDLDLPGVAAMGGMSVEDLAKDLRESSEKALRDRLLLLEVTKTEEIKVEDTEIDEELQTQWGHYFQPQQLESLKKESGVRDDIRGRILYRKALDWLFDNGDIKKGKEVSFESLRDEGAFNQ